MVITMLINMVYPIIECVLFGAIRHCYRMADQCSIRAKDYNRTKVKTLPAFIELYSGPEFLIHYKHSFILNTIFVTMLFGPAIPVLFPITLMTLIVFYLHERFMIAYLYRRPPMYDESINKNTIYLLSLSPFCYAISASWFFSNQQIFKNKVLPI